MPSEQAESLPRQSLSEPGNATTQTPATQADGDFERQLQRYTELVAANRAANGISEPEQPDSLKSLVDKMLADIPPPPSAEEMERKRAAHAEDLAKRESARRAAEWRSLVSQRGSRYGNCTLAGYEASTPEQVAAVDSLRRYAEQMPAKVSEGVNVVLFGPAGTGKDHLLAAMMQAAIRKYGLRVRWENGMDMFGDLRDRIDQDKTEADWVRSMSHPDILAISDPLPPFGTLKEFQAAMLFRVIDRRYSEAKPVWVTMNARNRAEAEERMGVQMIDRLSHGALVLFCNWPSYRTRKEST